MSLQEVFGTSGLNELRHWIVSRKLPLHFERSVRLSPAAFDTDRGLFSIPLAAIGPHATSEVLQICQAMSSPDSFCESIAANLADSGVVHFGFEHAGDERIGKCYLEFHVAKKRDDVRFAGFKWSIDSHRLEVVSEYRERPVPSWQSLCEQLLQPIDSCLRPDMEVLLSTFTERATATELPDVRLLEVSERGNDRRSFDLNLYELDVPAESASVAIRRIADQLDCAAGDINHWLHQAGDSIIGHLSFGIGRSGKPFLTVYYAADVNGL